MTPLSLSSTKPDPARTEDMIREERKLRREMKSWRKETITDDPTCADAETKGLQVSAYVEQLEVLLDGVVL